MSSSSDHDTDYSLLDSPNSFIFKVESPYNSPPKDNGPFLRILEQPNDYFRFRYTSEMSGTHGCLLGKSSSTSKTKTHPTVELMNYNGRALIGCSLARHDSNEEHPHQLLDEAHEQEVCKEVPEHGSYKVAYPGLGIIQKSRNEVIKTLLEKYSAGHSQKEAQTLAEKEFKRIELHKVRLKFSAHDAVTRKPICPPVFSDCINNLKNASTNDLKICRMSKCTGNPRGGDTIYLLVEKVNKKNIAVRFFEQGEDGKILWSDYGSFSHIDVHHQYAIVCRTPAYADVAVTKDVTVHIELVRKSDGKVSEPKPFTYKADKIAKQRLRFSISSSSCSSLSGGSINSLTDLPKPIFGVGVPALQNKVEPSEEHVMEDYPQKFVDLSFTSQVGGLGDAIFSNLTKTPLYSQEQNVPMLSQCNIKLPSLPDLSFDKPLNSDELAPYKRSLDLDLMDEYLQSYGRSIEDMEIVIDKDGLISDSANRKKTTLSSSKKELPEKEPKYTAVYSTQDGCEVEELVQKICKILKTKKYNKHDLKEKVQKLFDRRLSNGDTYLHFVVMNNQEAVQGILSLLRALNLTEYISIKNHNHHTALHLAVLYDMPELVSCLISKGADPRVTDPEGCNLVHFAVSSQTCLGPLLEAIKRYEVPCDIDAYTEEKQTALHIAAAYNSALSIKLLLSHGARYDLRDQEGRTPLHLSAYDHTLSVLQELLEFIPSSEVNMLDDNGNTALQIICGSNQKNNTVEMLKMLLRHKADPMIHEKNTLSAWALTKDKPELRAILREHIAEPPLIIDEDIKSENEDNTESEDEDDDVEVGLENLSQYERELCALLDRSGGWKQLAFRLQHDALLSWFQNMPSPTHTLLDHVKQSDSSISSKSLALLLEDIGETEAATLIRRINN